MGGRDDLRRILQVFLSQAEERQDAFTLAAEAGICIRYSDQFPKEVLGIYTPGVSTPLIVLNDAEYPDIQERACSHLIAHWAVYPEYPLCIDEESINTLHAANGFADYFVRHRKLTFSN